MSWLMSHEWGLFDKNVLTKIPYVDNIKNYAGN